MADLKAIADQLVSLTVKEVSELADILKEEHGIEPAAAAVAVAAGPAAGGAGGDGAAEEKTSFDVVLNSAGAAKLKVVKEVKTLLGLGLKDAKEMLDSMNIKSHITGENCDGSWYLNIRKMDDLRDFSKIPSRKNRVARDGIS